MKLLQLLVGDRPTLALSRQLGYDHNQVARWLSGYKQCRWSEFWDLCEELKAPLSLTLRDIFAIDPIFVEDPSDVLRHLKTFYTEAQSLSEVAEKLGCHLSALKRYLRGDTSCDLDLVLSLMDFKEPLLWRFVERLVGADGLSRVKGESKIASQLGHPILAHPLVGPINSCFQLAEYQALPAHSSKLVAKWVGTTSEEVDRIIGLMLATSKLDLVDNKYQPHQEIIQLEGMDKTSLVRMVRFWSYRAYLRLSTVDESPVNQGPHPNYSMIRAVALSPEGLKRLSEVQMKGYQEMCAVVDNDHEVKSEIRVILMHNFGAHEIPSEILPPPENIKMNL